MKTSINLKIALSIVILFIVSLAVAQDTSVEQAQQLVQQLDASIQIDGVASQNTFDDLTEWESFQAGSANFRVEDGLYRAETSDEDTLWWSINSIPHTNVAIQVDITQLSEATENGYGVICRADSGNQSDGYYFLISGENTASIIAVEQGTSRFLVPWQSVDALNSPTSTNRLMIVCMDDTLGMFVNDQLVLAATDGARTEGVTGFSAVTYSTEPVDVTFDNLISWSLSRSEEDKSLVLELDSTATEAPLETATEVPATESAVLTVEPAATEELIPTEASTATEEVIPTEASTATNTPLPPISITATPASTETEAPSPTLSVSLTSTELPPVVITATPGPTATNAPLSTVAPVGTATPGGQPTETKPEFTDYNQPASLVAFNSSPQEAIAELQTIGRVALGGVLLFEQQNANITDQDAPYAPFDVEGANQNIVLAGNVALVATDANEDVICALGGRITEVEGLPLDYISVGLDQTGDLAIKEVLSNGAVTQIGLVQTALDLNSAHHILAIMNEGTLAVFLNGQLVVDRLPVSSRAGLYGLILSGSVGEGGSCQASNVWAYAITNPAETNCIVQTSGTTRVNKRTQPGTVFPTGGQLQPGEQANVIARSTDDAGFTWWQTEDGLWVRNDVVTTTGDCESLPGN